MTGAQAGAGVPPKEAISYFRAKGFKVGFDHRDVWGQEHAHSFTVAKAMQIDILEAIRGGVDEALAEGLTYRDFSKQLTPLLQKLGWWGKQEMMDPATGESKLVQLGSPRRLKTIYDANLRTARAAGQWERIQNSKRTHPYLLYELGPSEHHRPEHESWAGVLLPVDDPWWQSHFTPNGYGCKCRVRQVSKRERERLASTGNYITEAPPIEYKEWTNKRTGETLKVPKGIDPGWDTNPGALQRQAAAEKLLRDKMQALPAPIRRAAQHNITEAAPVTGDFRQTIEQTLDAIPEAVQRQVVAAGFEVRLAPLLTEALPHLKGKQPRGWRPGSTWDEVEGITSGKSIAVAEYYVENGQRLPNARAAGVLRHEYGHALDTAIDTTWVSRRDDFIEQWNEDIQTMNKAKLLPDHDYMLALPPAGPEETFAEIFAELNGGGSRSDLALLDLFPRTTTYIKKLLESLK